MKELVEVIAKSLVEHPDEVVVTENEKEDAVIIELKVGPSDMGKVIGRQGRIAKAIRTVVKAASSKSSKKVIVDILPNNKETELWRHSSFLTKGSFFMEDLLKVGVITTTHGVRGEVKVYPTTDEPERFLDLEYVLAGYRKRTSKTGHQKCPFFQKSCYLEI